MRHRASTTAKKVIKGDIKITQHHISWMSMCCSVISSLSLLML